MPERKKDMSIENGKKNKRENVPKIVQIVPCNIEMYALTDTEDGGKFKNRVLLFALCDDGEIYPIAFDKWYGVPLFLRCGFWCERVRDGRRRGLFAAAGRRGAR